MKKLFKNNIKLEIVNIPILYILTMSCKNDSLDKIFYVNLKFFKKT